ncbi:hypothetical protein NDI37_02145 [Funiculus sociatus GB2-A5]|uniref:Uncharacterized protein n=1 Tax=Funiculus sociatus GB2-A5 TaxID=2933946 RepID=A0ABV0JIN3_9CYAN|nr:MULTISPECIES: hypothetical protein [unclassified Trichocoleus]MBD1904602.1 hypothetical protein [Trichocoleus sp. FACHB-832]MBD2062401.1 hypothetical protein [Trichocoleus sp. FACHB-6]
MKRSLFHRQSLPTFPVTLATSQSAAVTAIRAIAFSYPVGMRFPTG